LIYWDMDGNVKLNYIFAEHKKYNYDNSESNVHI
jgi:hypothetical protein